MLWILAAFLGITAITTLAAWRVGGKWTGLVNGPGLGTSDRVCRWLAQHYGLTGLDDCYDVRKVVRQGRRMENPALREAALGLAEELLSGRLRDVDTGSLLPLAFNTLPTALVVGTGLARQRQEYIVLGCMSLLVMAIGIWRVFKLPRRRIERARELNSVPPGALAAGAGAGNAPRSL